MATGNQLTGNSQADGAINAYRFVKVGSSDLTVAEANAGDRTIGVNEHHDVADGVDLDYVILGEAQLQLGSGGASVGDELESDADGKGVGLSATTSDQSVGAIALMAGSADDVIRVMVVNYNADT